MQYEDDTNKLVLSCVLLKMTELLICMVRRVLQAVGDQQGLHTASVTTDVPSKTPDDRSSGR